MSPVLSFFSSSLHSLPPLEAVSVSHCHIEKTEMYHCHIDPAVSCSRRGEAPEKGGARARTHTNSYCTLTWSRWVDDRRQTLARYLLFVSILKGGTKGCSPRGILPSAVPRPHKKTPCSFVLGLDSPAGSIKVGNGNGCLVDYTNCV